MVNKSCKMSLRVAAFGAERPAVKRKAPRQAAKLLDKLRLRRQKCAEGQFRDEVFQRSASESTKPSSVPTL